MNYKNGDSRSEPCSSREKHALAASDLDPKQLNTSNFRFFFFIFGFFVFIIDRLCFIPKDVNRAKQAHRPLSDI